MMAFTDSRDRNGSTKDESMHPEIILGGDNGQVLPILGDHPEREGEAHRPSTSSYPEHEGEAHSLSTSTYTEREGEAHTLPSSSYPEHAGEACKSSSSSSSDSLLEDDFFQLDASDLSKPTQSTTEAASNGLIFTPVANNLQLLPPITKEVETTTLQTSRLAPGFGELGIGDLIDVSQPPPVQEMVRSDVPDPYRIPSSVFARTQSTTPMDWSIQSNESLFSIHMGNSSFSRDQFILLGKPGELAAPPPALPPEPDKVHQPTLTPEEVNAEAMKDVLRAAADGHAEREKPPVENVPLHYSASRHSNGSTASINSFAFPILTGEVRSGSVRVIPDKQNHAPKTDVNGEIQNVEGTPKAAQGSWCTCFPCSFCR